MKKIGEIYKEYNIMPCLQMHQMRTAAVAFLICDSLLVNIDRNDIITACLIHDMGNIIKFNLEYFPEFTEPEGLKHWQQIKYDFIRKYGNNEHDATLKIAKELGVSDRIYQLIASIDSSLTEIISMEEDMGQKICIYSDNRVTPFKIVSIEERSLEAKERYKNHPHSFDEEKRNFFMENIRKIEEQIFSSCKLNSIDINDESIQKYLEKLSDFSI